MYLIKSNPIKTERKQLKPFEALVLSNLPIGQGLSSSAALEVAFFELLEGLLERNGVQSQLRCV